MLERVRATQLQVIQALQNDPVLVARLGAGVNSVFDHLPNNRTVDEPFLIVGPVDVAFETRDLRSFSLSFRVTIAMVWARAVTDDLGADMAILADIERILTLYKANGQGWSTTPFIPEIATTTPDAEGIGYDAAIRFHAQLL